MERSKLKQVTGNAVIDKLGPMLMALAGPVLMLLIALALDALPIANAGTVLLTPPPKRNPASEGPQETYPESRFGRPPAPVRAGLPDGFGSREVEEWDTAGSATEEKQGTRRPASLGSGAASTSPSGLAGQPNAASLRAQRHQAPSEIPSDLESQAAIRRKGVQEVGVIAGDLGFFPKTVFVTRDIPVRMFVTGASKHSLCIMMDSFQVRKQVRAQRIEEITFTPSTPGKYRFYCPVNGAEGTMIVKELASAPDTEGPIAQAP